MLLFSCKLLLQTSWCFSFWFIVVPFLRKHNTGRFFQEPFYSSASPKKSFYGGPLGRKCPKKLLLSWEWKKRIWIQRHQFFYADCQKKWLRKGFKTYHQLKKATAPKKFPGGWSFPAVQDDEGSRSPPASPQLRRGPDGDGGKMAEMLKHGNWSYTNSIPYVLATCIYLYIAITQSNSSHIRMIIYDIIIWDHIWEAAFYARSFRMLKMK